MVFESQSVSYKQALPPECWPRINKYLSAVVIAKDNGIKLNVSTYLKRIHMANKPIGRPDYRRKIFKAEAETMRELREKGLTCEQIGEMIGVVASTVSTYAPGYARGHRYNGN